MPYLYVPASDGLTAEALTPPSTVQISFYTASATQTFFKHFAEHNIMSGAQQ